MALWSALFIEFWKRNENITAMEWGMEGFEENEQVRPQFNGTKIRSPIHGHPQLHFSRYERFKRSMFSQTVITGLVMIVIAVIAVIFAIRIAISDTGANIGGIDLGGIISSILIALQIQFLNGFFGEVALKLNNYENHRTDTEYEDSLIAKTFCFQFVNSYASLFYIAFVKPFIQDVDPCLPGGCMGELQITLGTIFLTRLLIGNLTEIGIPLIQTYMEEGKRNASANKVRDAVHRETVEQANVLKSARDAGVQIPADYEHHANVDSNQLLDDLTLKYEMSEIEKNYTMHVYDVMLGPFDDYAEMAIQFGYTTMFVAAFPLATVLSFINNYVEIRVDAWKLCHLCRRPEPRSVEDIGTWLLILEAMSISSIFVNSGLIAFTSTNALNYSWVDRVWIFILIACGLFSIRYFVAWLIPDEPEEVKIQLKRQEYITDKVIHNIADEEPEELHNANFETPSYIVLKTDDDPM
jgi:threonine/homoserine/homoserine lactone efflux protein